MIYRRTLWVTLEGASMTDKEADFLRVIAESELLTRRESRGNEGVVSLRYNGLSSFDRLKPDGTIVGIYELSILMDVEATSEDHADSIMTTHYDIPIGRVYFGKYTVSKVVTIDRGLEDG